MTSQVLTLSLNQHCMNNVIPQLILNYSHTALHFPLHSGRVLKSYCFPPPFSFFKDFFNQTKWGLKVLQMSGFLSYSACSKSS